MPNKVVTVTAGKHRHDRRAQRQHIGSLENLIIKPSTAKRYDTQVRYLFAWLESEGIQLPDDVVVLDEVVSTYVSYLWESGDPRGWANDTLSGLAHHLPFTRGQLKGSWRLLQAWQRAELPARACPFTYQTISAMVGVHFSWGDLTTGVALLLGYHGLLRTGEILGLCFGHLEFDLVVGRAVIDLGFTKGGIRLGAVESCIITDARLVAFAAEVYRHLLPGDKLLPHSPPAFRRRFEQALACLELQNEGFKPYSLQRGGAIHFYRTTANLGALMTRGRWLHAKTARIYVTEAIAELPHLRWCPSQTRLLETYTKVFEDIYI